MIIRKIFENNIDEYADLVDHDVAEKSLFITKQPPKDIAVFFDVDGVLNKKSDWKSPFSINKNCIQAFGKLNGILQKKNYRTQYILCSTWRAGKSQKKNAPQYDFLESELSHVGIIISGQTPLSTKSRQEEIDYYAKRHGIDRYIVIDDDESLYPYPEQINIFIPDYNMGLTDNDVNKIIRLIRR